jgi:metal-responsive CopG/Arc/MetJ family transcriptional regulator
MLTKRKVVSLSLTPKSLSLLDRISKKEEKSRSAVVRDLIRSYFVEKDWDEIFNWGKETAKKFKIRSEADVLELIND